MNITIHFKNGTEQFGVVSGVTWLAFPLGLKKSDTLQLYACALGLPNLKPDYIPSTANVTITDTTTRTYMGSTRSVNVLTLTPTNSGVTVEHCIGTKKQGFFSSLSNVYL